MKNISHWFCLVCEVVPERYQFPLRNLKRFLGGLFDQYVTAVLATHYNAQAVNVELPLLLPAALVSLLRVHPVLADHVGYLGNVSKLVSDMAYEGRRDARATGQVKNGHVPSDQYEVEDGQLPNTQTRRSMSGSVVCGPCISLQRTTCAEAMVATSVGTPQVVPMLMKAIGWQGGIILALETLKRVVVTGNRARDAVIAQGLKQATGKEKQLAALAINLCIQYGSNLARYKLV